MSYRYEPVGSSIGGEVIRQLSIREKTIGNSSKTREDLLLVNSNSAWVKLRSSINQLTEDEIEELATAQKLITIGSNELAKSLILTGGIEYSRQTNTLRAGVDRGVGEEDSYKTAYTNYPSMGFRPMGGITSLKVSSKNTYGTLLEAEVSFTVWSLEDLEKCEVLYFRPGYTALLEWGHTYYKDNEENIRQVGAENGPIKDEFFFNPKKIEEIDKEIDNKREKGSGNYEGIYGYISNFKWSFREDGGYDCSITLISKGVILDGLKTAMAPYKEESSKVEETLEDRKTPFHFILEKLERYQGEQTYNTTTTYTGGSLYFNTGPFNGLTQLRQSGVEDLDGIEDFTAFKLQSFTVTPSDSEEDITPVLYIPFRAVLNILNKYNTVEGEDGTKLVKFSLEFGEKFNTYPDHFSINPLVAIPPAIPVTEEFKFFSITRQNLHENIQKYIKSSDSDDILNIMLSSHFIKREFDKVSLTSDRSSISIYDVLQNILLEINQAFGGINSFDIFYDHHTGLHKVIDRTINTTSPAQITVTGLNTTVTNLSVSSQISNSIMAQVSIAAQGNAPNYEEELSSLLEWNRGALDRHLPVKNPSDKKMSERQEEVRKYIVDLTRAWKDFNDPYYNSNHNYEVWSQLQGGNTVVLQKLYREYIQEKGKEVPGVVPVELELELLGISGLKVGQTFKISRGILPKRYDNFGYIITGLEHRIEGNNRWSTIIRTQFYPLRKTAPSTIQQRKTRKAKLPLKKTEVEQEILLQEGTTPNANMVRAFMKGVGYLEKGKELSTRGDITEEAAKMAIAVFKVINEKHKDIQVIVTGGNDTYKRGPLSRHYKGTAVDFKILPSTPANIGKIERILQGFSAGNAPYFRFLNEYKKKTEFKTADHFHMSWGAGTEGARTMELAIELALQNKINTYKV